MEKLVMALVHASKCLKRPRVSVKGQILADFIVERLEENSLDTPTKEEGELPEPWILFTDGSSCKDGSKAGLILANQEGMEFTYALRFRFGATNNEAEYEALIAGLRIAEQMGVNNLQVNVDSCLVANQVNGTYVAQEVDMNRYLEKGIDIAGPFLKGPGKVKFLIVAMDYFTKWIEAKLVVTITGNQIKNSYGTTLSADQWTRRKSKSQLRTAKVDLVQNNEALEINLDLLEERREEAAIREAKRKLGPKWEGSYEITEALGKGAYKLRDRDRKQLPWIWNISNLKKCYVYTM
ncbi:reverse transcriptase domain-containing protein [Tanacetum coccineum]